MKTDASGITWKSDDSTLHFEPSEIKEAYWCKVGSRFQLRLVMKDDIFYRFDGYRRSDYDVLSPYMKETFSLDLKEDQLGSDGVNWGTTDFEGPEGEENIVMKDSEGRRLFELGLNELSQCAFPSKNEVELQFVEEDTTKTTEESLVTIRFYVPQGANEDVEEKGDTAAHRLQQQIFERAGLVNNNGNMIAEIDERFGQFVTPRGRYIMEFYDNYVRMNGNNYTYKVLYKTISCIYMFEQPDLTHRTLVFCLTRPLRQGQQTYPHLVLYAPTERYSLSLSLSESVLNEKYGGKLQPEMHDEGYKLIAKLFKFVGGVKMYASGDFRTSRNQSYVRCMHKSESGLLYFMEKSIFFVHKPTLQITYDEISRVRYSRYDPNSRSGNRMFDIHLELKGRNGSTITFHNIDYNDFSAINSKFASKDIRQDGLKVPRLPEQDSDDDDEDFDDNSAANQESEDVDYRGEDANDESSDTDEMMQELVPESDDEKNGDGGDSAAVVLEVGFNV